MLLSPEQIQAIIDGSNEVAKNRKLPELPDGVISIKYRKSGEFWSECCNGEHDSQPAFTSAQMRGYAIQAIMDHYVSHKLVDELKKLHIYRFDENQKMHKSYLSACSTDLKNPEIIESAQSRQSDHQLHSDVVATKGK